MLDVGSRLPGSESSMDRAVQSLPTTSEERQRERNDFEDTIASLAERLRQLDARAEFLAHELRARDQALADQAAAIAMEQRTAQALQAAYDHLRSVQDQFWTSRAGRVLVAYERLKRMVLRR